MTHKYNAFTEELSCILDAYSGDLPTSAARARFHRDNTYVDESASEERPYITYQYCPGVLEGYTLGGALEVSVAAVLTAMADRIELIEPGDEEASRLRWRAANYLAKSKVILSFASEDFKPDVELAHAIEEMLSVLPAKGSDLAHDYLSSLHSESTRPIFYSNLGFDYPPEAVAPGEAVGMTTDVGYFLHLVASIQEGSHPALAAALRRFADIHYVYDLEFEFGLPDGSQMTLCEFEEFEPVEAAALVENKGLSPIGSMQISVLPEECAYSADDDLPFRAHVYPDEDCDNGEVCILVSATVAYRATVDRSSVEDGANAEEYFPSRIGPRLCVA